MNQAELQSLASRSLGEIAAGLPGATAVFRWAQARLLLRRIGKPRTGRPRRKGLDLAPIEGELAALSPEPNTVPESVEELIQHIFDRYHQVHRQEMPELRDLALRVERVHAGPPGRAEGTFHLLARMHSELELHMQKEEQFCSRSCWPAATL